MNLVGFDIISCPSDPPHPLDLPNAHPPPRSFLSSLFFHLIPVSLHELYPLTPISDQDRISPNNIKQTSDENK